MAPLDSTLIATTSIPQAHAAPSHAPAMCCQNHANVISDVLRMPCCTGCHGETGYQGTVPKCLECAACQCDACHVLRSRQINLDQANTTHPKPPVFHTAFESHAQDRADDRAIAIEREYCREQLASLLEVKPKSICFSESCQTALRWAIKGFSYAPGDTIILTAWDHHAALRAAHSVAEKHLAQVVVVEPKGDSLIDLERMEELLKSNTVKVIAMPHVSNVTGFALPVAEVTALAHQYGAITIVDCAQSVGLCPELPALLKIVDIACFSCHKGLFGPQGIGAMYVNPTSGLTLQAPGKARMPHTLSFEDYSDAYPMVSPKTQKDRYPQSFEALVTVPIAFYKVLRETLSWLSAKSIPAVYQHNESLRAYAIERLQRFDGVILHNVPSEKQQASSPIVLFNVAGVPCTTVQLYLEGYWVITKAGFHCCLLGHKMLGTDNIGGACRLSMSVLNRKSDVDRFYLCMDRMLKNFDLKRAVLHELKTRFKAAAQPTGAGASAVPVSPRTRRRRVRKPEVKAAGGALYKPPRFPAPGMMHSMTGLLRFVTDNLRPGGRAVECMRQHMMAWQPQTSEYSKFEHWDPTRYTRNLVLRTEHFDAILLCWPPGASSAIHDHADSACYLRIVRGQAKEQQYTQVPTSGGPSCGSMDCTRCRTAPLQKGTEAVLSAGEVSYIDNSIGLHKISNASDEEGLVTLHIYCPPILKCNIFKLDGTSDQCRMTFTSVDGKIHDIEKEGRPLMASDVPATTLVESEDEVEDPRAAACAKGRVMPVPFPAPGTAYSMEKVLNFLVNHMRGGSRSVEAFRQQIGAWSPQLSEYSRFEHWDPIRYTRNLILRTQHFDAILLCWPPGAHSAIHDHAQSACYLRVVRGVAEETMYTQENAHDSCGSMDCGHCCGYTLKQGKTSRLGPGEVSYIDNTLGLHKVGNPSSTEGLVTLHIYSPPILKCSIFKLDGTTDTVNMTFTSVDGVVHDIEAAGRPLMAADVPAMNTSGMLVDSEDEEEDPRVAACARRRALSGLAVA